MKVLYSKRGFTLVEMLVVISIIVVLAAILFPVFGTARESARRTKCMSNLSQLGLALSQFRQDNGSYPPPPYYSESDHQYKGGFSALYPDYIDDKSLFLCPDDRAIDGIVQEAKDRVYCSYNGDVGTIDTADESSWHFSTATYTNAETGVTFSGPIRYYNYGGYTNKGVDPYNATVGDPGYFPYMSSTPTWLTAKGLRYKHYPRLRNNQAPDTTIVTHCPNHRVFYKHKSEEMDVVLRKNSKTDLVNRGQWEEADATTGVSRWVTQDE